MAELVQEWRDTGILPFLSNSSIPARLEAAQSECLKFTFTAIRDPHLSAAQNLVHLRSVLLKSDIALIQVTVWSVLFPHDSYTQNVMHIAEQRLDELERQIDLLEQSDAAPASADQHVQVAFQNVFKKLPVEEVQLLSRDLQLMIAPYAPSFTRVSPGDELSETIEDASVNATSEERNFVSEAMARMGELIASSFSQYPMQSNFVLVLLASICTLLWHRSRSNRNRFRRADTRGVFTRNLSPIIFNGGLGVFVAISMQMNQLQALWRDILQGMQSYNAIGTYTLASSDTWWDYAVSSGWNGFAITLNTAGRAAVAALSVTDPLTRISVNFGSIILGAVLGTSVILIHYFGRFNQFNAIQERVLDNGPVAQALQVRLDDREQALQRKIEQEEDKDHPDYVKIDRWQMEQRLIRREMMGLEVGPAQLLAAAVQPQIAQNDMARAQMAVNLVPNMVNPLGAFGRQAIQQAQNPNNDLSRLMQAFAHPAPIAPAALPEPVAQGRIEYVPNEDDDDDVIVPFED